MTSILRLLAVSVAAMALITAPAAMAQPKEKEHKEQTEQKGGQKEQKAKHKHENGQALVGDKIKTNGKHKFHEHGKHSAYVNVSNGKIAGVSVTHSEKGEVPVKKYKTKQKMVDASGGGIQRVSLMLTQSEYLGTTYIGYSYIDDWGEEIIYWFPYDMILDGDTGAIEYVPAY